MYCCQRVLLQSIFGIGFIINSAEPKNQITCITYILSSQKFTLQIKNNQFSFTWKNQTFILYELMYIHQQQDTKPLDNILIIQNFIHY